MDKVYELIEGIKQNAVKQTILMNHIIEAFLKHRNNGKFMTITTDHGDISIYEIYNMAIEHMNNVEKIFDYTNEMPDCLVQLKENIGKIANAFDIDNENKRVGKPF